jgi:hypothetical protein
MQKKWDTELIAYHFLYGSFCVSSFWNDVAKMLLDLILIARRQVFSSRIRLLQGMTSQWNGSGNVDNHLDHDLYNKCISVVW